ILGGLVGALVASGVIAGVNWLGPARTSSNVGSGGQPGAPVTTASAVVPTAGSQPVQNHPSISAGPSLMGLGAKVWPAIVPVGAADPVGAPPAVAIGTIKGVNQQVRVNGGPPLLDAIDTDAPPGPAPGGALLDQSGRVVGITTETTGDGGGAHWVAAPAALVDDAADQLVTKGKVMRAWLGISADDHEPATPGGGSTPGGVQVLNV